MSRRRDRSVAYDHGKDSCFPGVTVLYFSLSRRHPLLLCDYSNYNIKYTRSSGHTNPGVQVCPHLGDPDTRQEESGGSKGGSVFGKHHFDETTFGSGCSLRASDPALEPQNEAIYLYGSQWHP